MKKITSKQRSYLIGLSTKTDPIFRIGRAGITPQLTAAVDEALTARELVKVQFLKNFLDDETKAADMLAERTRAIAVTKIGHKAVLYRESPEKKDKIILPAAKKDKAVRGDGDVS